MKKAITITAWIMFVFLLFLPVGRPLCSFFGFRLIPVSYPVFAVIPAFCGILELILIHKAGDTGVTKCVRVLFLLSVPLSLIGAMFYIVISGDLWTAGSCLTSFAVCLVLALLHVPKSGGKSAAVIVSVVLAVPVGFLCFISLVFGDIGVTTVVRSVESPSGSYRASIIDDDQGALGGATLVTVARTGPVFNAGLFRMVPIEKEIYSGKWGAFETMELEWIDDGCLSINGRPYPVE